MGKQQDLGSGEPGQPGDTLPSPEEWEGTLVVTPSASYDGELALRRRGEKKVRLTVPLPPAQALVLFIVKIAWDDDGGRAPDRRGYRTHAEIASEKRRYDTMVENGTIKVCVGRLRQTIRRAWTAAGYPGKPPQVIQTRRNLGYRLGLRLDLRVDFPRDPDAGRHDT